MREILFKAKKKDWRKLPKEEWWVEGYYGFCRKCHYILPVVNEIIGYDEREDEWIKIDLDTLCQYTGLTDKNGKKIWENDICEMVYNGVVYVYVVVWDKTELDFKGTNGKENYGRNFEYLGCCEEIEVIGNIFDNEDLLEVE